MSLSLGRGPRVPGVRAWAPAAGEEEPGTGVTGGGDLASYFQSIGGPKN